MAGWTATSSASTGSEAAGAAGEAAGEAGVALGLGGSPSNQVSTERQSRRAKPRAPPAA